MIADHTLCRPQLTSGLESKHTIDSSSLITFFCFPATVWLHLPLIFYYVSSSLLLLFFIPISVPPLLHLLSSTFRYSYADIHGLSSTPYLVCLRTRSLL